MRVLLPIVFTTIALTATSCIKSRIARETTCNAPNIVHEPSNAGLAGRSPQEYAWQLFVFLNRPADKMHPGEADVEKTFCDASNGERDLVWESWALASASEGSSDYSEVFRLYGATPLPWGGWKRSDLKVPLSAGNTISSEDIGEENSNIFPIPPSNNEEVRFNRTAYEDIVNSNMYNSDFVQKAIDNAGTNADSFMQFNADPENGTSAKEVKAGWLEICPGATLAGIAACLDSHRYYWRVIWNGSVPHFWGLAAMHIMTKDLNDWFWADFIHEDCLDSAVNSSPCKDFAGFYQSPPVEHEPRPETWGTQWTYYRLNGTMRFFGDGVMDGQGPFLANRVLEKLPSDKKSSCMFCHGYASAARTLAGGPPSNGCKRVQLNVMDQCSGAGTGIPDEQKFKYPAQDVVPGKSPEFLYLKSSFDWSIITRAHSSNTLPRSFPDNNKLTH
jgi:hypothetical protein